MTLRSSVLPQTAIITGGNTGLGYGCARTIAASHPNWHIVIASRNQQQSAQAVNTLQYETGNQHIEQMQLDLASLASVRSFAEDFAARKLHPLHAVICNAGIQVVSGTTYTQDGFETTFGVNCLGHFLLVNLLLRHLVAPAQIVFVSSGVHYPGSQDVMSRLTGVTPPRYRDPKALAWPEKYPDDDERKETPQTVGFRRYSTSKLCDLFYAYELSGRLQSEGYSTPEHPITVNAFDPGLMPGTKLARDHGAFERFAWNVILPALRFALPNAHSPNTSGKSLARLVLDPTLESITGKYFEGTRERASSEESYNQQEAAELWETSAKLVKLQPTETILRMENSVDEAIS